MDSGFSSMSSKDENLLKKLTETMDSTVINGNGDKEVGETIEKCARRREMDSGFSSRSSKDENLLKKLTETMDSTVVNGNEDKKSNKNGVDKKLRGKKMENWAKKSKVVSLRGTLKVSLDMCSKKGDVMGALELYDSAQREGIKMEQYHYTVLLYLCSSAATGVVCPAKSGSGSRSLGMVDSTVNAEDLGEFREMCTKKFFNTKSNLPKPNNGFLTEVGKDNLESSFNGKKLVKVFNGVAKPNSQVMDGTRNLVSGDYDFRSIKDGQDPESYEIWVSEGFKKYAIQRGFEIYEKMCLEKVPMNEASLTSVARMALAMGDGDMAFDTVKQMKALGINPRLRSYGPALTAFCNHGDIDKAFAVEEHMLENGVHPEEPEYEALLRISIEASRSDKVYYLLHKLRTGLRKVSPSIADLLEKWFQSKVASKVGKRKWDKRLIREAMENGGGGWHGQGWLGKGKWIVSRTSVGDDGLCKCCGEKLATIDLDPTETEKFAESVVSIAAQREKNSSFQKFQKWLDYYGPFEAVVDGANVGLFTQRKFYPSKVNAVVNGIRQLLPSKKWPLIVLHNKRITGSNMDRPVNKALIDKWKNADALYATPTGSNDDWYWLYAAIKFKCLIVTNDEMRDHLFQLLGNDFFPKWKERHQVHFSFSDTGPVFHMPPPCSVVIQESEKGHWHIPILSAHGYEGERIWLCVTRAYSSQETQVIANKHE
ncbi:ribonuclease P, partial [Sarracenia purpurea var. burkii]